MNKINLLFAILILSVTACTESPESIQRKSRNTEQLPSVAQAVPPVATAQQHRKAVAGREQPREPFPSGTDLIPAEQNDHRQHLVHL